MTENTKNELNHVAIIMDGNRRWATERGLPKLIGHTEGGKNLKRILEACQKKNIKYLTVWALSTENLKERNQEELKHLFSLFEKLIDYLGDLNKNNIRVNLIGDLTKLPKSTQEKLIELADLTKNNSGLFFTIGVNYGGRDEIIRTIKKIIEYKIPTNEITEELFSKNLDTADMPEPDLIIRTGGASRLSGLLPWQSIYSELYFTSTYWPAFAEEDLDEAIDWFQEQKRNRGK
jgi:undecaprenyl diphosphate synthase